ncbi:alpha-amylase family glycosyl hydrolase, partial [Escherichia coli]|uniref:alpha-amylase family glycosyl hydrolase n=1 Tax=Escherichia coli TaxID=562 RepID=UPI0012CED490
RAADNPAQSEYRQWYTFRDWPQQHECFFNLPIMPHLNLEHPPARQYIMDTARMWVEEYGVDGLRLEYAIKPSHDFWVALQTALVTAKPECVT